MKKIKQTTATALLAAGLFCAASCNKSKDNNSGGGGNNGGGGSGNGGGSYTIKGTTYTIASATISQPHMAGGLAPVDAYIRGNASSSSGDGLVVWFHNVPTANGTYGIKAFAMDADTVLGGDHDVTIQAAIAGWTWWCRNNNTQTATVTVSGGKVSVSIPDVMLYNNSDPAAATDSALLTNAVITQTE
jgi:hypothetical protein